MGKETKIGLSVLGLLLGVFGLVVYFKLYRTDPGPTPEALAAAALGDRQATSAEGGGSDLLAELASGPRVQLAASADGTAPVALTDSESAESAAAPIRDDPAIAARGAAADDWSHPATSSRRRSYEDPTADDTPPLMNGGALSHEQDPYAEVPDASAENDSRYGVTVEDTEDGDAVRAGEAAATDPYADVENAVEADAPRFAQPFGNAAPYARQPLDRDQHWGDETTVDETADIEAAAEIADPTDDADLQPIAEMQPVEPAELSPNPVAAAQGEAIQVDAEEALPSADDVAPRSGDRYGSSPPSYRSSAAEVPPAELPADLPAGLPAKQPAVTTVAPQAAASRVATPVSPPARSNAFDRNLPARPPVEPPPVTGRSPATSRSAVRSLPEKSTAVTPTPPAAASSGNFDRRDESYTVEPNDNYWRISQKLYGTGGYFKALFEHNRTKYPRADRLRAGDMISAPATDILDRTYPDLCPRPQHREMEQRVMKSVSARRLPRGGQVYVVEAGDTLFDIAKYELGQAARWGEILDLNREVLGEKGDHLKPGMELVLPGKAVERDSVAQEPGGVVR